MSVTRPPVLAVLKFVTSQENRQVVYEDNVCPKEVKEKPGSFNIKDILLRAVYMEQSQVSWSG